MCVCARTHFSILIKLSLIIFDANAQLLRNVLYVNGGNYSKQANKTPTICPAVYRLQFAHIHKSIQKRYVYQANVWRKVIERAHKVCVCVCVARVCAVSLN